jgi:hypothetical protein
LVRFLKGKMACHRRKGKVMRTRDVYWLVIVAVVVALWLALTFPSEVSTFLTLLAH